MVRRLAIALIALTSLVVGGVAVYFAMTVPNDVKAEALMREARAHLNKQNFKGARDAYEKVIRDYPRTDAASQSIAAVLRLDGEERRQLEAKVATLEQRVAKETARTTRLEQQLAAAVKAAQEKPAVVAPPAPAKKPTVRRATPKKKPVRKKKTPTRRRR